MYNIKYKHTFSHFPSNYIIISRGLFIYFFTCTVLQVLGLYELYFYILVCNCDFLPVFWLFYIPLYLEHIPTTSHPYAYVKFLINLWFLNIDLIVETKKKKRAKMSSFQMAVEYKM